MINIEKICELNSLTIEDCVILHKRYGYTFSIEDGEVVRTND